jgi:flagellar biosynthesis/type III secretory pathway ATPase
VSLPASLQRAVDSARALNRPRAEGRVRAIRGIAIHVAGLSAAIGDTCTIDAEGGKLPLPAEVVGFDKDDAVVMALGDAHRVAPWDRSPCRSALACSAASSTRSGGRSTVGRRSKAPCAR